MTLSLNMSKEGAPLLVSQASLEHSNMFSFGEVARVLAFTCRVSSAIGCVTPRQSCRRRVVVRIITGAGLRSPPRVQVVSTDEDIFRMNSGLSGDGSGLVVLAFHWRLETRHHRVLNGRTRCIRARGCFCWAYNGRRADLQLLREEGIQTCL